MSRMLAGMLALISLVGCEHKHSEAVVLEKEYIAAQAPTPAGPNPALTAETPAPTPEAEPREMAPDEIAVDGVVMKAELRGTSHDPRAGTDEQWLVKVRADNGRTFSVHADKIHFDRFHPGDRVRVSYREGKYTGTVWSADFE